MKKIELKSRKILRKIFGCISLTAVAFVFQACYGTRPDGGYDIRVTGTVESKNTNQPIEGIKVAVSNEYQYGFTDENGKFDFYAFISEFDYPGRDTAYSPSKIKVHFLDIDSTENGSFRDTTIIIDPAYKDEVVINMQLEKKE